MATTGFTLTPGTWTNLGAAPCYVQNLSSSKVFFVIDTAAPTNPDPNAVSAHILDPDQTDTNSDVNISLTAGNVYARGIGPVVVSR